MSKKSRKKLDFQETGESMKKHRKIRGAEKRAILEQTVIPKAYHKKAVVKKDDEGQLHIYYGGIGERYWHFHGHMIIGTDGKMRYHRLPFAKHNDAEHYSDGVIQRGRKPKRHFCY